MGPAAGNDEAMRSYRRYGATYDGLKLKNCEVKAAFVDETNPDACIWHGTANYSRAESQRTAPETGDSFTATGYYVQAGYALVPKTLGVGAGYSAIESSADNATKAFDASEIQLVINYYLLEHIAKVQADFSLRRDDLHDSADAKIARLQAQIIF